MDLDQDLQLIHQPARLRIMGLLFRQRDVSFAAARDHLELTDGNLASHIKRLENAGYVQARRVLTRDGFEMRYRITPAGSQAFRRYVAHLREFVEAMDRQANATPGASQRL